MKASKEKANGVDQGLNHSISTFQGKGVCSPFSGSQQVLASWCWFLSDSIYLLWFFPRQQFLFSCFSYDVFLPGGFMFVAGLQGFEHAGIKYYNVLQKYCKIRQSIT